MQSLCLQECRSSLLGLVAGLYRTAFDSKYADVAEVARSVPGVNLTALTDLDELLVKTPKVPNTDNGCFLDEVESQAKLNHAKLVPQLALCTFTVLFLAR